MQYSAIDDRIVVRPANQFGDLFRVDQAIEAVQCSDCGFSLRVVPKVCAQHFGVGEARADHGGVDAATLKILTGGAHHA